MKYSEIIQEMPVLGVEKHLDHDPNISDGVLGSKQSYRFTNQDKKYLSNSNYAGIVTKKLKYVPFDLFIYIVDTEKTRKIIRMVSVYPEPGSLEHYSTFWNLNDGDLALLSQLQIEKIEENYKKHPAAVHLLITHNDPYSDNWQPLTPWMILHRLGHSVLDRGQSAYKELTISKKINYYWYFLSFLDINLFRKCLQAKSARRLIEREELLIEAFVSFCITGGNISIKYPANISPADRQTVYRISHELDDMFYDLIEELKGKVWTG